ncbi:2Fe-2S iron-sulfur cluster-binding protein [Pelagibacteraceae bacterium]|nr:2Fe-2S iron-sulfur cluster-binding protein [Pelagibacteraceae bacterium]
MPKLIITDRSGKKSEIEFDSNFTLMENLRDNGYDIEASCGGCCACATCHVYIDEKWTNKLKNIDDDEESMLDQAFDVKNNSRLSCQIDLSEELDGLEIEIAPE